MTVAQLRALQSRGAPRVRGARSTIENGHKFQSKLEASRYRYWLNLWHCKQICWFIRQVPFDLPGNIIWRADFLVVWDLHADRLHPADDEIVRIEDCKGWMTDVSRNKIKQVEDIYGIKVHIIKKGDF